jgi:hypothetical protein
MFTFDGSPTPPAHRFMHNPDDNNRWVNIEPQYPAFIGHNVHSIIHRPVESCCGTYESSGWAIHNPPWLRGLGEPFLSIRHQVP